MADLEPDSALERELVDRLAGLLWHLRRVPVAEAKPLNKLNSRPYGIDIKTSCGTLVMSAKCQERTLISSFAAASAGSWRHDDDIERRRRHERS